MPIQFPEALDVPLSSPPLDEVICQVRFPPILRISTEEPAEFQDRIRSRYPEIQKKQVVQLQLPEPGNPGSSSAELPPITYLFINQDEQAQAVLAPSYYAVSTKSYHGWSAFLNDFKLVHEAVEQIYQPAYATRIGLRYINRLTAENTRITAPAELLDLVRDELTVTLRGKVWENATEMVAVVNFAEPPAQLNLRYGYESDESSQTLLLDIDHYEEGRIALSEVVTRCERYHEAIYGAFRWLVRDEALRRFGGEV